MPYMFCNHEGCNETVKLPANYCVKHTPFEQDIKASDLLRVPNPLPEPDSVKPLQDTRHNAQRT